MKQTFKLRFWNSFKQIELNTIFFVFSYFNAIIRPNRVHDFTMIDKWWIWSSWTGHLFAFKHPHKLEHKKNTKTKPNANKNKLMLIKLCVKCLHLFFNQKSSLCYIFEILEIYVVQTSECYRTALKRVHNWLSSIPSFHWKIEPAVASDWDEVDRYLHFLAQIIARLELYAASYPNKFLSNSNHWATIQRQTIEAKSKHDWFVLFAI